MKAKKKSCLPFLVFAKQPPQTKWMFSGISMDIILPPAPKDHATTKHLLTGCQLGILSFLGLEVLHAETTNPNQTISKKTHEIPMNFPSELPSFHAGEHELRLLQHVLWDVTSYLGWIGRPPTNGAFLAKICLN